jgi:hypothetical protein
MEREYELKNIINLIEKKVSVHTPEGDGVITFILNLKKGKKKEKKQLTIEYLQESIKKGKLE